MGEPCVNQGSNQSDERKVRFCVNNPRTLEERNGLIAADFECVGCLGNCARCFETRFLEIDDELIEGDSYQRILKTAEFPATRADAETPTDADERESA